MNKLIEAARRFIDQHELPGNVFKDGTEWGNKLHAAGQKDGYPYCVLGCEVWLKDGYPERWGVWDKTCSASAVQFFHNFEKAGFVISRTPVVGSIVIWQTYKGGIPQITGHGGAVETVAPDGDRYGTIEANTGGSNPRDGDVVAEKTHGFHEIMSYNVNDGLRLLGFIVIPE